MNKRLLVYSLVLLAVAAGFLTAWRLRQPAAPSSPVLAKVNGAPVTQKELEIRVASLLPMASYHGNVSPEKLVSIRRAALDDLIFEELVWQDVNGQGRRADRPEVDAEVASVRKRFASEDEFEAALREDGISRDAYFRYLERRMLVQQERQRHAALHTPSDAEILVYYEANGAELTRPEQVHLLEILVKVDPAGSEEDERASKTRAGAALARIRRGASFDRVAREVSEDQFRSQGGDLGWVHRGRLDRDLETAAFAAPVGEPRLARSISGFHVFTVIGREPARRLTLDEARPLAVDRVQRARRDATRKAWEDGLRAAARVEILDPVLREAKPLEFQRLDRAPAFGSSGAGDEGSSR